MEVALCIAEYVFAIQRICEVEVGYRYRYPPKVGAIFNFKNGVFGGYQQLVRLEVESHEVDGFTDLDILPIGEAVHERPLGYIPLARTDQFVVVLTPDDLLYITAHLQLTDLLHIDGADHTDERTFALPVTIA